MDVQVSPLPMVYSKGGNGVAVGMGVFVAASVGVRVAVNVRVTVGVGPFAGARGVLPPVRRKTRKTSAAPTTRNSANRPSAAGRLNVISGIRLAWMAAGLFGSTLALSSVPQTRQRVAVSASRVPQVGQIFVVDVGVSGLIPDDIIP
jgi:hypothetical protein